MPRIPSATGKEVSIAIGDEQASVTLRKFTQGDIFERTKLAAETEVGEAYRRYMTFDLTHSIESWNITDAEGVAIPVSEAGIAALPPEFVDAIHEQIQLLNPTVWPDKARPTGASTPETSSQGV